MISPRTLLLLGYGRFGQALADLALAANWRVRACDPRAAVPDDLRAAGPSDLLREPGLVLMAVPMESFEGALEELLPHLREGHSLLEVSSVKHAARECLQRLVAQRFPWAMSHPLFGPMSLDAGERPLRVVLCSDTPHPSALESATRFYRELGCLTFDETSDEHDRSMAETHALAFFVAKGMLAIGVGDESVVPPSFQAMAHTIESVRGDGGHLFLPIQNGNPHARQARARLLEAMGQIHSDLERARALPLAAAESAALSIAPGAAWPGELGEARASIDALDAELMQLLQRRARIALRAARAKAESGRALRDPEREAALLKGRRRLALENGLDPGAVSEVFEAIMKFSRGEQRRWLDSRPPKREN